MPASLRKCWWWLSDPAWRREYGANRRRIQRFRVNQRRAVSKLLRKSGDKILSGPFAEMRYTPARQSDSYCAQVLLGTYELELREVLERICREHYAKIIVAGAAEGYYACGFRYRRPDFAVVAFELDEKKHSCIAAIAAANGHPASVKIRGACDAATLQAEISVSVGRTLVFCDIDGGEVESLDPQQAPALLQVDLLVETHDALRPGVTELLQSRFCSTHDIEVIPERERTVADAPQDAPLIGDELIDAMDEFRGCKQLWLWMTPKSV